MVESLRVRPAEARKGYFPARVDRGQQARLHRRVDGVDAMRAYIDPIGTSRRFAVLARTCALIVALAAMPTSSEAEAQETTFVCNSNSTVAGINTSSAGNAIGVYGYSYSSAGYAVYAAGSLAYTGTLSHLSDERLKKNIDPLEGALGKALKLRGVTYQWKEPAKHGGATGRQTGFIAQEVEAQFPDWVGTDADGFKMLNTDGMSALLLESARALKLENDTLRERVKALEDTKRGVSGLSSSGLLGFTFGAVMLAGAFIGMRRKGSKPRT